MFAFAATNAVFGSAVRFDQIAVIFLLSGEHIAAEILFGVVQREILRYRNVLRTAVHAVRARGAGDGGVARHHIRHSEDYTFFFLVEGTEVFHIGYVVVELRFAGHTAQNHKYVLEARRKTYRPRSRAHIGRICAEKFFRFLRHACEVATFYGLHDYDGFAVRRRNFVTLTRLYRSCSQSA